jgi:hypothetical protein
VQIEHRLIQNFLDVGAVEIVGELGDVRGGWQICSRKEITGLALVGRPNADGWDASVLMLSIRWNASPADHAEYRDIPRFHSSRLRLTTARSLEEAAPELVATTTRPGSRTRAKAKRKLELSEGQKGLGRHSQI